MMPEGRRASSTPQIFSLGECRYRMTGVPAAISNDTLQALQEAPQAGHAGLELGDGTCEGQAEIAGRAEALAGNDGHARALEQLRGQRDRVRCAAAQIPADVREDVEAALGTCTGDAVDRADRGIDD